MKRWPIIRHFRWLFAAWRVHRHAQMWARYGIGLGVPNPSDMKHLDMIWDGVDP